MDSYTNYFMFDFLSYQMMPIPLKENDSSFVYYVLTHKKEKGEQMEKKIELYGVEVILHYKHPPDKEMLIPACKEFLYAIEKKKKMLHSSLATTKHPNGSL